MPSLLRIPWISRGWTPAHHIYMLANTYNKLHPVQGSSSKEIKTQKSLDIEESSLTDYNSRV